jgi:hypothetical protein
LDFAAVDDSGVNKNQLQDQKESQNKGTKRTLDDDFPDPTDSQKPSKKANISSSQKQKAVRYLTLLSSNEGLTFVLKYSKEEETEVTDG